VYNLVISGVLLLPAVPVSGASMADTGTVNIVKINNLWFFL
jgi:hypothetical protein